MRENPADACLVIAELAFGDRKLLAGGIALTLVRPGEAVEGVHHRTRALMVAGEHAVAGRGSLKEDVGGTAGMQHQAEIQAAISAKGEAFGVAYRIRQGIEPAAKDRHRIIATERVIANGQRIAFMVGRRRQVGRETLQASFQPGNRFGQFP